jgi:hypothetical protein
MAARMPARRSVGRDSGQHDRHTADARLRGGAVAGRGGSARRVTRLCRLGHVVRPGADHGRDRQGVLQGTGKRRRSHILPSEPHGSCFDLIALVGHDVRAYPHRHGGTPRRSPPDRRRAVPAHVAPARSAGSPPSAPPRWPCGSRRSPDQLRGRGSRAPGPSAATSLHIARRLARRPARRTHLVQVAMRAQLQQVRRIIRRLVYPAVPIGMAQTSVARPSAHGPRSGEPGCPGRRNPRSAAAAGFPGRLAPAALAAPRPRC